MYTTIASALITLTFYIIAVTLGYRSIVKLRALSSTLSERQSARERKYTLVLIVQASRCFLVLKLACNVHIYLRKNIEQRADRI